MDHASAHLMPFPIEEVSDTTIDEGAEPGGEGNAGDIHIHNKEQHQESAYYKQLGEAIIGYDEVILFGPTDAKTELYNLLMADSHFEKIKIEVEQTDKMTENQLHAFVRDYFSKN